MRPRIVVIGCSLGGLDAIQFLLSELPPTMPAIVIAQHRLAGDPDRLSPLLRNHSPMPVVEPDDKETITPGHVYVAPADYHLHIEDGWFSLSIDPPVLYARPSIDILFESAAEAYGAAVVGVVMTGASEDGALGAKAVVARKGRVLVQDPATALAPIAPTAALKYAVEKPVPLEHLPARLVAACGIRPPDGNARLRRAPTPSLGSTLPTLNAQGPVRR